jgi:hypothetical protein
VVLDGIFCGGDDVEDHIDSILFLLVASTVQKWRKFKLLRVAYLLNRSVDLDETLYGGDGVEYCLDYVLFNPVVLTVPKWSTFKHLCG